MATTIIHESPDEALRFVIVRDDDGDVTLGFSDHPWHTHGDILAKLSELSIEQAIAQHVDALLSNRSVIAIATTDGKIRDDWIDDDPLQPDPYKPDNETIAFRFWDGTPFDPGARA
jgi:hypothetical protein